MRVLGFSELWPKLGQHTFTTFRYIRKDKDWAAGEQVQIVFDKRGPQRSVLGIAEIVKIQPRCIKRGCRCGKQKVSINEAQADGFKDYWAMWAWFYDTYHNSDHWPDCNLNRITLAWQQLWLYVPEQKEPVALEWAKLLDKKGRPGKPQYLVRTDVLEAIHDMAAVAGWPGA